MTKTCVRIDDRLIHDQTIVAWCPTLSILDNLVVSGLDFVFHQLPNKLKTSWEAFKKSIQ